MGKTEDPVIIVDSVSKSFRIPLDKSSGLKQHIVNVFQRQKGYREFTPLNDVSFTINKGEFFGIVGRNGSGKSTLLKTIAGIYTPDSGAVHVGGSLTPFIELGVGFNPELTGRENVFLNGALLGFSRKDMEAMYDDIVDFAELHDFMEERLKNYSSGMQVRLAFSIAIRADTDILILDEVLAVGDANFQKKCFDYFRKLKADKKTVILVSHDMEAVRKFTSRAILIEKGRIVFTGNAEDVSDEYIRRNIEKENTKTSYKDSTADHAIGGKAAYIESVTLLDADNKKVESVVSGKPIKIAIKYTTKQKIEELNIGVGLHADAGGYVFSYNTQMDDFKITDKEGVLSLYFDNFPILPGNYYLNLVCFGVDEAVPYDYKPHALSFNVYGLGRELHYRGIVKIEHQWQK